MELLELVPNVSEGRSKAAVDDIGEAFALGGGVRLLDRHSDDSHNRSVLTAVAEPDSVLEASGRLIERAIARIDLRSHRGVHPRIGAVDVLPLVPLGGFSRDRAKAIAISVGRSIADSFGIPVFLYADSALRPENRELPRLRRGGFEALEARMAASELVPDYGPNRPHPTAGAAAGGGGPPLPAAPPPPPARARGSMNPTDFRVTSLQTAFDAVEREAARLGVEVARSEIVGLIPEAAPLAGLGGRRPLDRPPR